MSSIQTVLEREAEREALEALKEVLERYDLTFTVGKYGDELQVHMSRNIIKTVYHQRLGAEDLTE
jgi:hypothetical protein